jgi:hypothetical protein
MRRIRDQDEKEACLVQKAEENGVRCAELTQRCNVYEEEHASQMVATCQAVESRHTEALKNQEMRCSELSEMCLDKEERLVQMAKECRDRARHIRSLESHREEQRLVCEGDLKQEFASECRELQSRYTQQEELSADLSIRLTSECNYSEALVEALKVQEVQHEELQEKFIQEQERSSLLALELDEEEAWHGLNKNEMMSAEACSSVCSPKLCKMEQDWNDEYARLNDELIRARAANQYFQERLSEVEASAQAPQRHGIGSQLVEVSDESFRSKHLDVMEPSLCELVESLEAEHHILLSAVHEQEEFSTAACQLQEDLKKARAQLASRREREESFSRLYEELLQNSSGMRISE